MKTFNQFVTEVQAPLSQGEKAFFTAHNVVNHKDLVPGVTDQEHVFNGSTTHNTSIGKTEDQSKSTYDKGLKREEVELEEKTLTPAEMKKREEIVKSLKNKGMEKGKAYAIATSTAKRVAEENDDGWYAHREMHGSKGISKDDWKKGWRMNSKGERVQMKKEEIELLERNKENKFKKDLHVASLGKSSIDKFDVDHDKMAKDFGHSRDRIRDTMKSRLKTFKRVGRQMTREESEQIDELSDKMLASMQKNDLMKTRKDAKAEAAKEKKVAEEIDQIDEISKEKALNYIGSASYDKSSHASDIGAINQVARTTGTNDAQRKEREALSKKHGNRSLGIQRAAHKLAGKHVKVPATEEVENVNELDHHGILSRYIRRTDPERNSSKENEKRKAGRALALSKKWANHTHGDIEPKIKARVREEAEQVDEARTKKEDSNEADQNIHVQLNKSLSIGKHVVFKNGDKKQIPAAHANKALHMLRSAKPAEREQLQNSMSHSHDRFTKTVTHGRAVVDHPGEKKVTVAKSVKEAVDPTTTASDRGAMKTMVRLNPEGRPVLVKRSPARDEIKIGEALDPVGKEDSDIDNDGRHNTKSDKYLHNRRKTVKAAIKGAVKGVKEEVVSEEDELVSLSALYDVLSDENKVMFEELLETDEGIERLLSFAREYNV